MRLLGWIMISLGVVMVIWSCVVTTSVHTDPSYLPGIGYQASSDTYNLGLLQRQMMMLQSGLALFLAGTVAVCVAELRNAMRAAGTARFVGLWETEGAAVAAQNDVAVTE